MRFPLNLRSYPARLVVGVFILILLTTLSAGVPAYWLTRTELERQAWSHVAGAEQATDSLLRAKQAQLDNLLTVFTERPTLRHLLSQASLAEIPPYLRAFQAQSSLDILYLCSVGDVAGGEDLLVSACPQPPPGGFQLYQDRPALLASRPVSAETAQKSPAIAVAGWWLDEALLRQLAMDTGVVQSILLPDGTRFASSMGGNFLATSAAQRSDDASGLAGQHLAEVGGHRYFTAVIPLAGGEDRVDLMVEVALPIDQLMATQDRALAVLAFSTGAIALLGALVGIWTVRRLIGPLEQLTRSAEAISGGNLAAPVPLLPGPLEVRALAAALQQSQASMLSALADLAQTRDWLNSLVQSIVEGVVTFDGAGRVTFINERAAALASISVEEAAGRNVDQLFAVSDESGNRISLRRLPLDGRHRVTLIGNGTSSVQPLRYPGQRTARRLGRSIALPLEPVAVLEVTPTRLRTPSDEEMQTALIMRDITQDESLLRLRSYFLANITHEFRTPLSTLNASMELLMNEPDLSVSDMRELLKPIRLSLLGLQTLIDNLLESSSIEAGRFVIRSQPVDLNQVITDAVGVVQALLERRAQTLSLTEPAFLPPLLGDAARLTQVLVNLLSNASKYSPMYSAIDLNVEEIAGRLRFAVADQGPGIPSAEREKLFQRFVRLDTADAEQYGIGLGLYVVKTTIEAHGGRVGVDEHPGGGSVFWCELPFDRKEDVP